eukprot:13415068-Alexandrium_andersonii.AAC.1
MCIRDRPDCERAKTTPPHTTHDPRTAGEHNHHEPTRHRTHHPTRTTASEGADRPKTVTCATWQGGG